VFPDNLCEYEHVHGVWTLYMALCWQHILYVYCCLQQRRNAKKLKFVLNGTENIHLVKSNSFTE